MSISHSKHVHSALEHSDPNQKLRRHYLYIQHDQVLPIALLHKSKQFNDSRNINKQVGVASGASVNQLAISLQTPALHICKAVPLSAV
jgi:hypothetical protein